MAAITSHILVDIFRQP